MAERLVAVVDADIGGFVRGMSRVDQRLASTSRGMGSVSRGMAGLGRVGGAALLGVGAAAITAGGALGVMGIKFGSMKQQALTSFKVLLGSGKAAQRMFNDLNRFAAKTPFEFPDLATAAQRMLAMGWSAKRLMPDLRAIGDAAAASPQGMVEGLNRITTAMGQMKAKGKASAEELMQLTEAGIPAWKFLADAAGKSVADIQKDVEKGAVSSDQAISALLGGMKRKYGGMMAEQSKTLAGSWSTLKDTISQSAGAILEPMIPLLTRASQAVSNALGSKDGKAAIQSLTAGVTRFGEIVGQVVSWTVAHWPQISATVSTVVGTVVGAVQSVVGFVQTYWPQISAVAQQVWTQAAAYGQTFVAWVQGTLWPTVSAIVDMLVAIWQRWGNEIKAVFSAAVQYVQTSVRLLLTTIDTIVKVVGAVVQAVTAAINGDWSAAWGKAKQAVKIAWDGIREAAGQIKDGLGPILRQAGEFALEKLGDALGKGADVVSDGLAAAWDGVTSGSAWKAAAGAAKDLAEYAGEQLGDALGALGGVLSAGLQKAFDGISGISWGVSFSTGSKTFGLGPLPDISVPYPTGIQFGAKGGRFASMAVIGEAGPEWVIPTDPAYRNRALGLLYGAAQELGVSMNAKGKAPKLTPHAVNFKQFGRSALSAQETMAQRYSDDTNLYLRGWQRDGTMTDAEWGKYVKRLSNYRMMLGRLYSTYSARSGVKLPERGTTDESKKRFDDAKARRDEARQKRDATRGALLGLMEDVKDAQRQRRIDATPPPAEPPPPPAPFSLDQIAGVTSLDEQIAIAEAGLGGDRVSLLKRKRELLKAAFDRSKSQSERALIAREIGNVDSQLGTGGGGAFGGSSGGGGGGSISGGGGGPSIANVTNTLNLTVQGNVATERDLADAMLRLFVEWARSGKQPLAAVGFGAG